MGVLQEMADGGFEQVVHCHDAATGLRAIIAIHSTRLGPALGGTRCLGYPSEDAALTDVCRLARGMTYKAAAAGLDLGGGKAVIIGDPRSVKTEALLRAYGRFIEGLYGRYRTAEDVGTTQADMDVIRRETRYVTGFDVRRGGSGDPSEATARGVHAALGAVASRLGAGDLREARIVISGVGKVGGSLARLLVADGADVTVADTDPGAVATIQSELGVTTVPVGQAHRTPCDIFSPCALGGVLSAATIPELACRAVAGAANNQLAEAGDAKRLADRGVLYAPDFIVNAGGIINIAEELSDAGYDPERAYAAVGAVAGTTQAVFEAADTAGITTAEAAEQLAERRLAALGNISHLRAFP